MDKIILIADDDPTLRELLVTLLSSQGYQVLAAENGDQLVRKAQERMPDLLLVDLMMPQFDGYEAIRQLRNDTRTAHLPMLILTARSASDDVVIGFESGADDYITKPFNTSELLARIKSHLRRAAQRPVHSPLTGLPGNVLLSEELKYRIKQNEPFALLYIDLNNFKAFNDTYGFARGDRVIKLMADVLRDTVAARNQPSDFIGHIGGDDFAVMTTPDAVQPLCAAIHERFNHQVRELYDPEDLERGYLEGVDRQGQRRHFPLTSASIGGVTNLYRHFDDYEEMSRIAAEMKHVAKTRPGSLYAMDTRGANATPTASERRGSHPRTILLVSGEAALRERLANLVQAQHYRALSAADALETHALLAHESVPPDTLVFDTRLGEPIWKLVDELHQHQPPPRLLALAASPDDSAHAAQLQVPHCPLEPLTDSDFLARIYEINTVVE
ncbi:MAG: response regulator [Chloroflexaceae bacterium]|jgi:diguanylate cyclase (GGDEF)-like protein|nr:response regulator [Chloroflexaceae bacterium]